MSLLDGIETSENMAEETDTIGKFETLPSGLQNLTLNNVYMVKAKTGAVMVTVDAITEAGVSIKDVQCIRSGDKKGNRNFYMVKDRKTHKETGEKAYLPGYMIINSLHELITGNGLDKATTGDTTVEIYNYSAKCNEDVTVEAFTDLAGKKVSAGILRVKVDKKAANDATGEYEPTGEYREENEINKYFDYTSKLTLQEKKHGVKNNKFIESWHKKYADKLIDKTDKKFVAKSGSPATGKNAGTANLFG